MKTLLRNRAASSLLTDLRMEDASGFRNFTRMSATDFEFLLNLIGARLTRQDTNYRKCITVTEKLAVVKIFGNWRFLPKFNVFVQDFKAKYF